MKQSNFESAMNTEYVTLNKANLATEHICCAIADKKHQPGVEIKKRWILDRLDEGHVFRKLDQKGKVFIEYAPLETAWTPVVGDGYLHIYCLWVSGSFKGKGHAKHLLEECILAAKRQNKAGVCILSSKKKTPFLSEKSFFMKRGFEVCDSIDDYELLALSFHGAKPTFSQSAKRRTIAHEELTIYYSPQCPYIPNCIEQISAYCETNKIPLRLTKVDTLEKAKAAPCVFNNWAVFYKGKFQTVHLLNEGYLAKLMKSMEQSAPSMPL